MQTIVHITYFPMEAKYAIYDENYNLVKEWFDSMESAREWIKENNYEERK